MRVGSLRVETIAVRFILVGLLLFGLVLSGVATLWFDRNHVGLMIESVADVAEFKDSWQALIDSEEVTHPAVIHWLPEGCLCSFLTSNHAANVTQDAEQNGFHVYQLQSSRSGLGVPLTSQAQPHKAIGSLIAITNVDGQIAYLGAYSDGVRCNTGNSMVTEFLASPSNLPSPSVVSLDVETCIC